VAIKMRYRIATIVLASAIVFVAAGCTPRWTTVAPSSVARQEVSYVYVPEMNRFYLAGGKSTLQEAYDPTTNEWSDVAPLPEAVDHLQSVALHGRIYYIGGLAAFPRPSVATVYIYDAIRNTFSRGADMPAGRERGAGGIATYNGKIYIAGGLHDGSAVAAFDVYDPATNTWTEMPDMPRVRDHFQGAVVGNRFYAIGGRNTTIAATITAADAFDFSTNRWLTGMAPLPTPRGGFGAAFVGTRILIVGGETSAGTLNRVEAYDTAANTWQSLAPMRVARHGIQAAVSAGLVYVADGGTRPGGGYPTNIQEVYDPSAN